MSKKTLVILSVLFMVIGFASIATNLVINGNTKVGYDENNFKSNVVFTRAETLTGTAVINGDEKNIDFESIKLENINQATILDFDVANKSREYDSSVTITCGLKEEFASFNEYLDINMSLPSPFDLLAGETKSGELAVTLKKAYDQALETSVELKCTLTATPIERESLGNEYVKPPYKDIVLNGADPVLDDEGKLVPVKIASDGTVTAADIKEEWYNYTNKEWANAVILNDGATYTVGETIPETDIESYFVWIPKYKYQIFDMGNYSGSTQIENKEQEIQIEFTTEETTDSEISCVSPKVAGESGTCSVGKWMTHPAFQNFGVTGLWVGKFETGYNNENNRIIVKPNVNSWNNQTVATYFTTSLNYNIDLVSHMMKNTEWGAAAYLSHSKYGINTEVRTNNNSNHLTGYAETGTNVGSSRTDTKPYNTAVGILASTTGNITGVYDMSGGVDEYVAGCIGVGSSGLTSENLIKYANYIDTYPIDGGVNEDYNYRILGDATGEMGPFSVVKGSWYKDGASFVSRYGYWFSRGGYDSNRDTSYLTGVFNFTNRSGNAANNGGIVGSRIVLAVN